MYATQQFERVIHINVCVHVCMCAYVTDETTVNTSDDRPSDGWMIINKATWRVPYHENSIYWFNQECFPRSTAIADMENNFHGDYLRV